MVQAARALDRRRPSDDRPMVRPWFAPRKRKEHAILMGDGAKYNRPLATDL
jgi:hypothetical protein